ncbi:MAG: GIY-YIG nuclease family protein [Emcibacter sp.]|nr:GIY-YIG nuclease family protein [Emcibacter sp.]
MTNITSGTLYFLTNPAIPDLVKIGYTTGKVTDRIKQISKTGTPVEFQVAAQFSVFTPRQCEIEVHEVLKSIRPNPKREFFKGSVINILITVLPTISKYIDNNSKIHLINNEEDDLEQDDIYFMIYLLHDGYANSQPISTMELVQHHLAYSPLELEYKLLKLAETGLIKRTSKKYSDRFGVWALTTDGLKFMFERDHILHDLIEEDRRDIHH